MIFEKVTAPSNEKETQLHEITHEVAFFPPSLTSKIRYIYFNNIRTNFVFPLYGGYKMLGLIFVERFIIDFG